MKCMWSLQSWGGVVGMLGVIAALAACSVQSESYTPLGNPDQGPPADASEPPSDAPPVAPTCHDGQRNGDETDVDCGGGCAPCAPGGGCGGGMDCRTGVCEQQVCQVASCDDGVQNEDETDVDCGGSCGPCGTDSMCVVAGDCSSQVCSADGKCQAPSCVDGVKNGDETDIDCGGALCGGCGLTQACALDRDCANHAICDPASCRVARSCDEIIQGFPGSADGVYTIAPAGSAFDAVCDMSFDGGGWTLLLKADGDATLAYAASAWTDLNLLDETDLTTAPGNAKYQGFLSLPITTLRGELDGFNYTQPVAINTASTAVAIFNSQTVQYVQQPFDASTFNIDVWPTQPNCQTFGINTLVTYAQARFGWTANQEPNCATNDTGIGLGIQYAPSALSIAHGAGRFCQASGCQLGAPPNAVPSTGGNVAGNGLLWGR